MARVIRIRSKTGRGRPAVEALALEIGQNVAHEVIDEFMPLVLYAVQDEAGEIIHESSRQSKHRSTGNLVDNIILKRDGDTYDIRFAKGFKYRQINEPIGSFLTIFPKNGKFLRWPNRKGLLKRGRGGVMYKPSHLFAKKVKYPGQRLLGRAIEATEGYIDSLLQQAIREAQLKHNATLAEYRGMKINDKGYKVRRKRTS